MPLTISKTTSRENIYVPTENTAMSALRQLYSSKPMRRLNITLSVKLQEVFIMHFLLPIRV